MTPHLICTCLVCGAVWDLDMQPSECTCVPEPTDDDDTVVELVMTDDWRAAVAAIRAGDPPP